MIKKGRALLESKLDDDAAAQGEADAVVDELLGKQEVVIKALGEAFDGVRGIAGGAILGDGRVGLILDAGGLLSLLDKIATQAVA